MNASNMHENGRHQRLRELVDSLFAEPASEWAALLQRQCPDDHVLRTEALRLLEHDLAAGVEKFLDLPTQAPDTGSGDATYEGPTDSSAEAEYLGKYRIVRRFTGPSGQAAAYLAFDPDLARHVVLKRYHHGDTAEERARMVVGSYPRQKRELLAPFAGNTSFRGLAIEEFEMAVLRDTAWDEFEKDGDKEALATKHSLFFRSVFLPSLGSALTRVRAGDGEALPAFGDQLESGMKRHLASQPAPAHSVVQTIVLVKQAP